MARFLATDVLKTLIYKTTPLISVNHAGPHPQLKTFGPLNYAH